MADHISIRDASGTWVVRASGAVVGESTTALELVEGGYAPVIYFPRADIGMSFLEESATTTECPHKGTATYYSVVGPDGEARDAAWSYENPKNGVSEIAGHIAFHTDRVAVEKL
ncbi:DUF427 domain-containing protein [Gymnodinialimonas ceratoperidinii]|uniref:DUF427 domain-containing protein n=1 Tax=Gymnodinialimonas ceratoperidinii TaxID=2856823 RepID=A0A8F6YBT3_9RHOB|nr:DUF427 domain-containing protein [Gymnodinialimonas ceratoperidinii]QXT41274.1 DUF427 domain-containing protein [Gymnodinialimonas ceratoperidinii]